MEVGLVIAMFVCNALALNFMVNGKHKLSDTRFWRIYGDTSVSYEVSNNFLKDRAKMKNLIEFNTLNELKKVI